MSLSSDKIEELKKLIAVDKIEEALDQLLDLSTGKDKDFSNSIHTLTIQFERCTYNKKLGIIPFSNANNIINRISTTTFEIIKEIGNRNMLYLSQREKKEIEEIENSINNYLEEFEQRKKDLREEIEKTRKFKGDVNPYIDDLRQINEKILSNARRLLKRIDFVNRNWEKEKIQKPFGKTTYWLLDAPAGYGKTELMRELVREHDDEKYIKAFIQINHKDNISKIFKKIATELELNFQTKIANSKKKFCEELPERLLQERRADLLEKELVIFIDFDGKPSGHCSFIQKEVMPTLWEGIHPHINLSENPNKFKIIYAGRHLSKHANSSIKTISLSDFDFRTIVETIKNHEYYHDWINSSKKLAAGHILYLTGGHPLCISQALSKRNRHPIGFITNQKKVYKLINLVAESIEYEFLSDPSWHFPIFKACSVFRKINSNILKKIKDGLFSYYDLEVVDIDDMLRRSHLWNTIRYTDVLSDGIASKVLTIDMRRTAPEQYKQYCAFAKESCFEQIEANRDLPPRYWFIEYLFQSLQVHALDINDTNKRQRITENFYRESGDFMKGLEKYKNTIEGGRLNSEINDLLKEIDIDEEFQFTVNYYLRKKKNDYDEAPIQELKQKINNGLKK